MLGVMVLASLSVDPVSASGHSENGDAGLFSLSSKLGVPARPENIIVGYVDAQDEFSPATLERVSIFDAKLPAIVGTQNNTRPHTQRCNVPLVNHLGLDIGFGRVSGKKGECAANREVFGGSLSTVGDFGRNGRRSLNAKLSAVLTNPFAALHIGSKLNFGTSPILAQINEERDKRATGKHGLNGHPPDSPIAKDRRGLLGREIAFFAFLAILCAGLSYYSLRKAIDTGNVIKTIAWAGAWFCFAGVAGYGAIIALFGSV